MLDMLVVATLAGKRAVPAAIAQPPFARPTLIGLTPWSRRSGDD
jgi:hypothetical protein